MPHHGSAVINGRIVTSVRLNEDSLVLSALLLRLRYADRLGRDFLMVSSSL